MSKPTNNRKYQSFLSRIRDADTHEDAEQILRDLTPARIEELAEEIVEKRGNGRSFENKELYVWYTEPDMTTAHSFSGPTAAIGRKAGDEIEIVYRKRVGNIEKFEPLRCWKILNVIEEIINRGEIGI